MPKYRCHCCNIDRRDTLPLDLQRNRLVQHSYQARNREHFAHHHRNTALATCCCSHKPGDKLARGYYKYRRDYRARRRLQHTLPPNIHLLLSTRRMDDSMNTGASRSCRRYTQSSPGNYRLARPEHKLVDHKSLGYRHPLRCYKHHRGERDHMAGAYTFGPHTTHPHHKASRPNRRVVGHKLRPDKPPHPDTNQRGCSPNSRYRHQSLRNFRPRRRNPLDTNRWDARHYRCFRMSGVYTFH